MKALNFYEFIEKELFPELMAIMKSKGEAYSGHEDKFGNFKRIAQKYKIPITMVWAIYFGKHLDSLDSWLRGEYVDSEPIEGRIKDLINYLFLLYGLIEEKKNEI